MSEVRTWSTTAASNNDTPPDGWPENMAYANVNNCAREMMASIARHLRANSGAVSSTGTATALALAPGTDYSTNAAGDRFSFKLHRSISSGVTLTVGSADAADLKDAYGRDIEAGLVTTGQILDVVFVSGSGWHVQNSGGVPPAGA